MEKQCRKLNLKIWQNTRCLNCNLILKPKLTQREFCARNYHKHTANGHMRASLTQPCPIMTNAEGIQWLKPIFNFPSKYIYMKQRKCIAWLHCNTAFKNVGSANQVVTWSYDNLRQVTLPLHDEFSHVIISYTEMKDYWTKEFLSQPSKRHITSYSSMFTSSGFIISILAWATFIMLWHLQMKEKIFLN